MDYDIRKLTDYLWELPRPAACVCRRAFTRQRR